MFWYEEVPEILEKKCCCILDSFRMLPAMLCLQVHFWNLLAVSHTRRVLYLFCMLSAGSFEVTFFWTFNLRVQNFLFNLSRSSLFLTQPLGFLSFGIGFDCFSWFNVWHGFNLSLWQNLLLYLVMNLSIHSNW